MRRIISSGLSGFKYLIALFFMYEGFATATSPLEPYDGRMGWVYSTRPSLVAFGVWFFLSGLVLFVAKIRRNERSDKWVGRALMSMYLAFLFGSILNGYASRWDTTQWLPNLIASGVLAALYLRWKYHILYVDVPIRRRRRMVKEFLEGDDNV